MNTRPCSLQEAKQHLLEKHESRLRVYMRLAITGPYRVRWICPVTQRVLVSDNTDREGWRWISPKLETARWFVEDLRPRRHRFVALMFRRRAYWRHEHKFRTDPRYRSRYAQAYALRNAPRQSGRSFEPGGIMFKKKLDIWKAMTEDQREYDRHFSPDESATLDRLSQGHGELVVIDARSNGRSAIYPTPATPGHQLTAEEMKKGADLLAAFMRHLKKGSGKK